MNTVVPTELRVRFGEVDQRRVQAPGRTRQEVAADVWAAGPPDSEAELARQDLAFSTSSPAEPVPDGTRPPRDLAGLLAGGWLVAQPIVYEDFLPRSAAGILASDLSGRGRWTPHRAGRPGTPTGCPR